MGLMEPTRVEAFEWRPQFLGSSTTRPCVVAVRDENAREFEVVLKVRYPTERPEPGQGNYGKTSLACELICAVVGRALGLNIFDYYIVDVAAEWVAAIPYSDVRERLRRNSGTAFGLHYRPGVPMFSRYAEVGKGAVKDQLEDVLTFDATVINGDRKLTNPNLLFDGETVFPIDHSLAIPGHRMSDGQIGQCHLFPPSQVSEHCSFWALSKSGRKCDRLFQLWSTHMPADWSKQLRAMVPSDWEEKKGDLDRIFRFLEERVQWFSAIATDLQSHLR